MVRSLRTLTLIGLGIIACQSPAKAWGPIAHEAIGMIAEHHLSPTAKAKVKALIKDSTLGQIATWPDSNRQQPEWTHTKAYHFAAVPDRADYFDSLSQMPQAQLERGDVVLSVLKAEEMLRSQRTSPEEKGVALTFLVHFVGDLHQPMHTGRGEDKGGNDIKLNWLGRKSNLHQAWDSSIIETAYAKTWRNRKDEERALLYARGILRDRPKDLKPWLSGFIEDWFNESLEIRPRAYQTANQPPQKQTLEHIEVINQRVLQAGLRLSALINDIFDPAQARPEFRKRSAEMRERLTKLLGQRAFQYVSLLPNLQTNERAPRTPMANPMKAFLTTTLEDATSCDH